MFRKLLVANRGEIAVRVIRACRDLGIETVAVFSEADRGALHVRMADEAHLCGPARASESYLSIPRLVEIASRCGADAVHPGYGFLSENGDFAEACAAAGVTFVGPAPEVLRSMGDKVTSRRIMAEAGVPVVPGSSDALDDEQACSYALEIGLPVMVKASAGGGGRGMRVVAQEAELPASIERARSEAAASFGSDAIYIEKYIDKPRHIEVQILADAHGNVVHLFERECSIQRRHQKLLEEAPANIDATLREALAECAVNAARIVGYVGAGTVEFLVDADDHFFFLEMNTRVQVEHAITEAITSVDIVKQMIRIASGEPLQLTQNSASLQIRGHAIEARIYAEDPDRGFLPSPGPLLLFRAPGGMGIRVDSGVQTGDVVTPHYDPMLAKLVAWGEDREEAIDRLDRALSEFAISGVKTSISFHRRLLRAPEFVAGEYDTKLVAELLERSDAEWGDDEMLRLAIAVVAARRAEGASRFTTVVKEKGKGGSAHPVELETVVGSAALRISIDGEWLSVDLCEGAGGAVSSIVDGRQLELLVSEKRPGRYEVRVGEKLVRLEISI